MKWFIKLLLILIIVISVIIFIFLLRPKYFIYDIELFIENQISSNTSGNLDIGNIEGNFIKGFQIFNIMYKYNDEVLFSASEMYIDPDLSSLIFGEAVLSEAILFNSYYQHSELYIQNIRSPSNNYKFGKFNYKIRSLVIKNSIVIYKNQLYKLYGGLKLTYRDTIKVDFNNFSIISPQINTNIIIPSGSFYISKDEIIFNETQITSGLIEGKLNGAINFNNYSLSYGNIRFKTLSLPINDSSQVYFNNFNLSAENINNITILSIDGNMIYKDIFFDNISAKGILNDDNLVIDSANIEIMHNLINVQGNINFNDLYMSLSIIFEDFSYGDKILLSGIIDIESTKFLNNFEGHLFLDKLHIQQVDIDSVQGKLIYNRDNELSTYLNLTSKNISSSANLISFIDQDNYSVSGFVKLDELDISTYISQKGKNNISGNIDFNVNNLNGIKKIDIKSESANGYLLNSRFDNFIGIGNFLISDDIITGYSQGSINNWAFGHYDLSNLIFKAEYSDPNKSKYHLSAFGNMGDSLEIIAERLYNDKIYISTLEGVLKQSLIYSNPFYIGIDNNSLHIPLIDIKIGSGNISLKGNLKNYSQYDLAGTISNINLKEIYSIIGNSYPLKGEINEGRFILNNIKIDKTKSPYLDLSLNINNGTWDEIKFNKLTLKTKYQNRKLDLFNLNIETSLGFMRTNGWCNIDLNSDSLLFIVNDNINLLFEFDNIDFSLFNRYLPWSYDCRGSVSGLMEINGTADNPIIIGTLGVNNPGFDRINSDSLYMKYSYSDHQLNINHIDVLEKSGRYSGFGLIPMNLDFISRDKLQINKLPIDFMLTGLTNNFELLPPYFQVIDSIRGEPNEKISTSLNFKLAITGTLDNPVRNGQIIITNGLLFLNPIDEVVTNIFGQIKINNNKLIIDNLTGTIKQIQSNNIKIPFIDSFKRIFNDRNDKIENNVQITGVMDISDFFNPNYSIHMTGKNIHLTSSYNLFHGTGTADIYINGRNPVLISGNYQPNQNDFAITSLGEETFIDVGLNQSTHKYMYDIHIPFIDGVQLITEDMNILLEGDVMMSKYDNQYFSFSGKIDIINGRYYDNQGNVFENISGNIYLSPEKKSSYIDIYANTQISPSTIDVSIIGNPKNPQIYFSDSEGYYNQTELLSILAYGNQEIINDPNQVQIEKQVENFLTNYFENEIEKNISRNTPIDEFQLSSSGSLFNSFEGKEDIDIKLIVGKRLSNRMYVNTHINFYDFYENQYEAEYRLSKNTSIIGGLNINEGNNSFHIKYRIKYYY